MILKRQGYGLLKHRIKYQSFVRGCEQLASSAILMLTIQWSRVQILENYCGKSTVGVGGNQTLFDHRDIPHLWATPWLVVDNS